MIIMKWEGYGRKWSRPISKNYPTIYLERRGQPQKNSVTIADLWAKIQTRDLPNTKQEC
jgi:hypothetical protein